MNTAKEHSIIFLSEMVRAILEGRKTQTRRVIKHFKGYREVILAGTIMTSQEYLSYPQVRTFISMGLLDKFCPYGQPGDRLWVRETFAQVSVPVGTVSRDILTVYKADNPQGVMCPSKWKSSCFMPRWASRINLEIVNVRVEKLQEIRPIDAFAEGVRSNYLHQPADWIDVDCFHELWNSINAKRGYGWDVNPWVWKIEFKVVK